MTEQAEKVKEQILEAFDKAVEKLPPLEYYEVMEELQASLECRMACVREENPGDFE